MSARYRVGLLLALALQLGLLGWMIVDRALILNNGREIHLAVVPIDPRDLFRGDFVTLSYAFSRVRAHALSGDDDFSYDDTIYTTIVENTDGWEAAAISHAPPADGVFLRGKVRYVDSDTGCPDSNNCWSYVVAYNIEQHFVPEGEGEDIEALRNDKRVSVDVAVDATGRAALKRLLIDGAVRYEEKLL
jgi:uncharacterized membrane-anchored protein